MSLLLALLAVTATCTPNPALANAGPQRVRDYIAAINRGDEAAVGRYLKPGAVFSNPEVDAMPLAEVMTLLLGAPNAEQLEVIEASPLNGVVFLRTSTPSGSTAAANVFLDGGCVSRFEQG